MEFFSVEVHLYAALFVVWNVHCEPSCDLTEFLHPNGTCVECPVCGPGQQLSEDCGFGDGGEGVCVRCKEGTFSAEASVAPCRRCTQCSLLNRMQEKACAPISDAHCGRCLPGFYELRSMTGEAELSCVPCNKLETVHKECSLSKAPLHKAVTSPMKDFKESKEEKLKEETFSVALIGSATASSVFLVALLLWAFLLTAEGLKHVPEHCPGSEGLLSAADAQQASLGSHNESAGTPTNTDLHAQTDDPLRSVNSLSRENEVHPTSIVINVTTNIKSSNQKRDSVTQEKNTGGRQSLEEVCASTRCIYQMCKELYLERYVFSHDDWSYMDMVEIVSDQSIEALDYDSVQDLSLLLDPADRMLKKLGRSLGVPPHVLPHLQGFQDLFQYLRTSTYTLLPQLAQAAALLPNPQVVARIHRAVVNK